MYYKIRKYIYPLSIACFILCAAAILAFIQFFSPDHRWLPLALPDNKVIMILLAIGIVVTGANQRLAKPRNRKNRKMSRSWKSYRLIYDATPFLGAVTGLSIAIVSGLTQWWIPIMVVMAFNSTFLVWIIIDPFIILCETLITTNNRQPRKYAIPRTHRIAASEISLKDQLEQLVHQHRLKQDIWKEQLSPTADRLVELILTGEITTNSVEREVVDIGVEAWQTGGNGCMKKLHEMVAKRCNDQNCNPNGIEYVSLWWDGIGNWRNSPIDQT